MFLQTPDRRSVKYVLTLETARENNRIDLLLCHQNINSIQNKFEELKDIVVKSLVQILAVSETKIDVSYPHSQFLIPGYYLHRNDRKKRGGAILILVSSKIQSLCHVTQSLIDVILTNRSGLFGDCGVYNPELSDHALVYGFIKERIKPQTGRVIKFRSTKYLN